MKKLLSKSYLLFLVLGLLSLQTNYVAFAADEPPTIVDPFATEETPAEEPPAEVTPAEEPPADDTPPSLTLPPAETLPVVPAAETAPVVTTPPAPTHTAAPTKTASVPIKTISKSGPEILVLALMSALMGAGYRKFKK